MKRVIAVLGSGLMVLLGVVTSNAVRLEPREPTIVPKTTKIPIDAAAVAHRLGQAIRYRTVSTGADDAPAGSAFRGLHEYLRTSFPGVHALLKRETVNENSLLFTWPGRDPSLNAVLFSAHMDVVPAGSETEQGWTHPPFEGAVADGFVWGRGTMDMKGSMMALLEAVEHLVGQGFTPKRTIHLAFGHDEEIGGNDGAGRIARLLKDRGVKLAYTLDEGLVVTHGIMPGIERPVALIGIAEKGIVTLELSVRSPGGHGSMPPSRTAIGRLGRALARVEENPMPAALRSPVIEMFEHVTPEMQFLPRLVFANRWLFEPAILYRLSQRASTNALIRTTAAITVIRGGVKSNVIPQSAKAIVNVRILPGDTVDSVITHMRRAIDDPDVVIAVGNGTTIRASGVSDTGSTGYQMIVTAARQVFPDALVAPGLLVGTTDTRHYSELAENSFRFQPLRLKPNDLARFHGTDERISIDNYLDVVRFYIQLMRNDG